jgi:hypothetical protein
MSAQTPRLPPWLIQIVSLVVVFGGLNLVVIGAQKLWHWTDQRRLDSLKAEIAAERTALHAEADALTAQAAPMDALQWRIKRGGDALAARRQAGISDGEVDGFNRDVRAHNALVQEYNDLCDAYRPNAARYEAARTALNQKVTEANALIEKIGGTWFVIPIPGGRTVHEEPRAAPRY